MWSVLDKLPWTVEIYIWKNIRYIFIESTLNYGADSCWSFFDVFFYLDGMSIDKIDIVKSPTIILNKPFIIL
jgi:hypothetical protein